MSSSNHNTFYIRCRGVIIHNDKLLIVKHDPKYDYYALPGGHMDYEESVEDCIKRELVEELGVEPKIGRLLYVNVFNNKVLGKQSVEIMFEVINGEDYADLEKIKSYNRSHAFEIEEMRFVSADEKVNLLPTFIWEDFVLGKIKPGTNFPTQFKYNIKES